MHHLVLQLNHQWPDSLFEPATPCFADEMASSFDAGYALAGKREPVSLPPPQSLPRRKVIVFAYWQFPLVSVEMQNLVQDLLGALQRDGFKTYLVQNEELILLEEPSINHPLADKVKPMPAPTIRAHMAKQHRISADQTYILSEQEILALACNTVGIPKPAQSAYAIQWLDILKQPQVFQQVLRLGETFTFSLTLQQALEKRDVLIDANQVPPYHLALQLATLEELDRITKLPVPLQQAIQRLSMTAQVDAKQWQRYAQQLSRLPLQALSTLELKLKKTSKQRIRIDVSHLSKLNDGKLHKLVISGDVECVVPRRNPGLRVMQHQQAPLALQTLDLQARINKQDLAELITQLPALEELALTEVVSVLRPDHVLERESFVHNLQQLTYKPTKLKPQAIPALCTMFGTIDHLILHVPDTFKTVLQRPLLAETTAEGLTVTVVSPRPLSPKIFSGFIRAFANITTINVEPTQVRIPRESLDCILDLVPVLATVNAKLTIEYKLEDRAHAPEDSHQILSRLPKLQKLDVSLSNRLRGCFNSLDACLSLPHPTQINQLDLGQVTLKELEINTLQQLAMPMLFARSINRLALEKLSTTYHLGTHSFLTEKIDMTGLRTVEIFTESLPATLTTLLQHAPNLTKLTLKEPVSDMPAAQMLLPQPTAHRQLHEANLFIGTKRTSAAVIAYTLDSAANLWSLSLSGFIKLPKQLPKTKLHKGLHELKFDRQLIDKHAFKFMTLFPNLLYVTHPLKAPVSQEHSESMSDASESLPESRVTSVRRLHGTFDSFASSSSQNSLFPNTYQVEMTSLNYALVLAHTDRHSIQQLTIIAYERRLLSQAHVQNLPNLTHLILDGRIYSRSLALLNNTPHLRSLRTTLSLPIVSTSIWLPDLPKLERLDLEVSRELFPEEDSSLRMKYPNAQITVTVNPALPAEMTRTVAQRTRSWSPLIHDMLGMLLVLSIAAVVYEILLTIEDYSRSRYDYYRPPRQLPNFTEIAEWLIDNWAIVLGVPASIVGLPLTLRLFNHYRTRLYELVFEIFTPLSATQNTVVSSRRLPEQTTTAVIT